VKLLKKIFLSLLVFFTFWLFPKCVYAVCEVTKIKTPSGEDEVVWPLCKFVEIFKIIVNSITTIAILIFFIMMLVGGFRFLFSGGDAKAVEKARDTLMHAIIGLIVLILIWFLLLAVQAITGVKVTEFYIGTPGST
jgi:hypothetical protein